MRLRRLKEYLSPISAGHGLGQFNPAGFQAGVDPSVQFQHDVRRFGPAPRRPKERHDPFRVGSHDLRVS